MANYWDFASNMTTRSDYWNAGQPLESDYWGIPINQSPNAEYWNIETMDFNDPGQMLLMDMAAASLEGVIDEGALEGTFQGMPLSEGRGIQPFDLRDGSLVIDLGAGRSISIYIPEEARSFVQQTIGEMAARLGSAAEEHWGKMLTEGADVDEFIWWPKLKPSTVKNKEQQYGLTPTQAQVPNFRTGETARKMMNHSWGPPAIEEVSGGMVVSWGPKIGMEESRLSLKYREMYQGAGPGTLNPASGRGLNTFRPARAFGFVPSLRPSFDAIIREWIMEVNGYQQQFGLPQIDQNNLLWTM